MGLEVEDADHDHQNDTVGHQFEEAGPLQQVPKPTETSTGVKAQRAALVSLGQPGREIQDESELAQLRGLPADGIPQPAGSAVDLLAQAGDLDRQHQHEGHQQDGQGQALEAPVVQARDEIHHAEAHDRIDELPLEIVERVAAGDVGDVVIGRGIGGRQQHHQTDDHQQDRQQHKGHIHGPLDLLLGPVSLFCSV